MLLTAVIFLLAGIAVGIPTGMAIARDRARRRRTGDRITRGSLKAAKTGVAPPADPAPKPVEQPVAGSAMPYALAPREGGLLLDETGSLKLPPEWPGLTLGQATGYLTVEKADTSAPGEVRSGRIPTMTTSRSPFFAAPEDPEHREPPTSIFERRVLEEQSLPDSDARGVARVSGPVEPVLRAARVLQETSGEHRIPGEVTDWLGRHHLPAAEGTSNE